MQRRITVPTNYMSPERLGYRNDRDEEIAHINGNGLGRLTESVRSVVCTRNLNEHEFMSQLSILPSVRERIHDILDSTRMPFGSGSKTARASKCLTAVGSMC